jgi:phosphatidylserine/phosphatidylglycerophosphate/cardiolipin synthase-like enzyme
MEAIIGKEFPKKVIPLIEGAKKSIKIIVFDWRWYPHDPANPVQLFNQALVRAKRRGVDIKVLTNMSDIISILNNLGIEARKLTSKNLLHAKVMIIDDEILIIGSHNYTQSAFTMNLEVSIIIKDQQEISRVINYFNNLYEPIS